MPRPDQPIQTVLIVGAGLAGLACARVLDEHGVRCTLLESGDDVGGRVRSDHVDGFTLDRGFQILVSSYPLARRLLNYPALNFHAFEPGAEVRMNGRFHRVLDPVRRPAGALATAFSPVGRLSDKIRLALLRQRLEPAGLATPWTHEKPAATATSTTLPPAAKAPLAAEGPSAHDPSSDSSPIRSSDVRSSADRSSTDESSSGKLTAAESSADESPSGESSTDGSRDTTSRNRATTDEPATAAPRDSADRTRSSPPAKLPNAASAPARVDQTTIDFLRDFGFTPTLIDSFIRPFFGGVFCESELDTSAAVFRFLFNCFAEGSAVVPAQGMGAIPRQMAGALRHSTVELGARVQAVGPSSVTLLGGETLSADAVVVATDSRTAARLLPGGGIPRVERWAGSTTLYFATEKTPIDDSILLLNGEARERRGLVNSLCDLSSVCPAYAPTGAHLMSLCVVGVPSLSESDLIDAVRRELRGWFGSGVDDWRHLRTYAIPHALPDQSPQGLTRLPFGPRVPAGAAGGGDAALGGSADDAIFICGDYCDTASSNGAMASGVRAAEAILQALKG